MNKQNIEQIIRELFRENFNLYPESYPLGENGLMSDEGTITAQEVAKGYYANRAEFEIERDEKAGVTEIYYVEWVMAELSELIPPASRNKFSTWAAEINKDWASGFNATATDEALTVAYNNAEIARIDYNGGRYSVSGNDQDSVAQLEHMTNR